MALFLFHSSQAESFPGTRGVSNNWMIPCLEQPEKACVDADVYLAAGLTSAGIKLPLRSSFPC